MNHDTPEYQAQIKEWLSNHMLWFQTSLVEDLIRHGLIEDDEFVNQYEYETQTGDTFSPDELDNRITELEEILENGTYGDNPDPIAHAEALQEQLDELNAMREDGPTSEKNPLGWYLVDTLAPKLKQKGECMIHAYGQCWWGRCCSGQSVYLDGVIQEIYEEYTGR